MGPYKWPYKNVFLRLLVGCPPGSLEPLWDESSYSFCPWMPTPFGTRLPNIRDIRHLCYCPRRKGVSALVGWLDGWMVGNPTSRSHKIHETNIAVSWNLNTMRFEGDSSSEKMTGFLRTGVGSDEFPFWCNNLPPGSCELSC